MASKQFLHNILEANSVESRFYIEHGGYFSNHLCHGIIALYRLNAPEDKIAAFTKAYSDQNLEIRDQGKSQKIQDDRGRESKSEEDIAALLGKRTRFYDLIKHYKSKGQESASIDNLLASEFPKMMNGTISAVLHPLIHTGYGYSVGSLETVVEGLAYQHHSYSKFDYDKATFDLTTFGKGKDSLQKVLLDLRADKELYQFMKDNEDSEFAIGPEDLGPSQKCMKVLTGLRGNDLMTYAHRVKIGVDPGVSSPTDIAGWITDAAIDLFTRAEFTNEFFILHGVTSSWALEQFVHALPNPLEALRLHLCNIFAVYLSQEKPELKELEAPERHLDWKEIIDEMLALPMDNTDEHVFKLIQVCHDRSKINPDNDRLYKMACISILSHPLCYRGTQMAIFTDKFTPRK